MLNPKALDAAFGTLMSRLVAALAKGGVIAIDGKSLQGAYDKRLAHAPRMMVSAFATGLRLTLASVAAKNGNDVNAALEVLGLIDLKGLIVTGDALHCNRKMAAAIVAKGGDYCLTLIGQSGLALIGRACGPRPGQAGASDGADREPSAPAHRDARRDRGCGEGARRTP
jgi:hypothetical protein